MIKELSCQQIRQGLGPAQSWAQRVRGREAGSDSLHKNL